MSYASDMLSDMGRNFLRQPKTPPTPMKRDPYVRERGAANLPMIPEGRDQIHERGNGFAQQFLNSARVGHTPRVQIVTSPWSRTQETAAILAQHLAAFKPTITQVDDLAPRSEGSLEGEKTDDVRDLLDQLKYQTPDVAPPGRSKYTGELGESQDSYAARVLPVIQKLIEQSRQDPNLVSIVAAHSSDMKAAERSNLINNPRDDRRSFTHARTDHISPDGTYYRDIPLGGDRLILPGVYLQHHGSTEYNMPRPEMLSKRERERSLGSRDTTFLEGGNASANPVTSITGQY